MEAENEMNSKKNAKMKRNKISILIIGFYAGLCVISDLAVKYYFKDKKKVETANLTRILIIFKIPYLIKPIYGLILDFIPICGYKKKSYLFICFLVNISSWYLFIISNEKNMLFSIICLLFVNISLSFTTVIGSAIQVDLSKMYENEKSNIGEKTSQLMSEYFIIKSLGTLIPSYFKGFLIAKYSNDIIFYISGIISFLILISDLILVEEKNIEKNEERVSSSSLLDNEEKEKEKNNNKKENTTQQILNLIKNKNIIILLSLIFILESSPFCMSPLFYYETNFLNLNPQDLSYVDFLSQIAIIIVIYIYKNLCFKYNFKAITFFVRIF
jgi:Na+/melibiose symporter-like transporter